MHPHIPYPKYCIVGLPITLCKLMFVQIYDETFQEDQSSKTLAEDILRVIQRADGYYANRVAFERKVLDMLAAAQTLEISRQEISTELDWFFNRVLSELKEHGFLQKKLPFNSLMLKDQDSLFFARIDKKDLVN